MTRTQLYLPESQYQELKELARQNEMTFAELAREFLTEKLQERKRKPKKAKRPVKNAFDLMLKSAKKLEKHKEKGEIRDGSVNHDQYLYGPKNIL